MRLGVYKRREAGHSIVVVSGDLDHYSVPALRDKLLPAGEDLPEPRIVVDLAGLRFIDSAGLGLLVEAYKRNRSAGGSFALTAVPWSVRRVLQVTGLDTVFRSYESVEEALADGRLAS